jgi:hypothetical protein
MGRSEPAATAACASGPRRRRRDARAAGRVMAALSAA